jgi:protein TonB
VSALGKSWRRWRRALAVVLGLVLAGALVWLVIKAIVSPGPARKKRTVQEISLLKPPPPPPPPKVAPPPKVDVQEKLNVPKPDQQPDKQADAPPPGPNLALDAVGGAGGDGFGLVGRKGGADLIGSSSGAGAGSRFAWYGALVRERIRDVVSRDKKLREADYRVTVNMWINASGTVTRAELLDSTGSAVLDAALKAALRNLPPLREGAPGDMPQPIKLRITAR